MHPKIQYIYETIVHFLDRQTNRPTDGTGDSAYRRYIDREQHTNSGTEQAWVQNSFIKFYLKNQQMTFPLDETGSIQTVHLYIPP